MSPFKIAETILHLGQTDPKRDFTSLIVVREGGLEPPRPFEHWHLKPARLPFRHSRE